MNEPNPSARPTGPRPGGRSARVQAAVHQAVRDLQQKDMRDDLTVPMIAARAGVTPSTIYRRWGDLSRLLADVALEQFQPDNVPTDTGSYRGDLDAWLEQYLDEMSSRPGRAILRDVLGAPDGTTACRCDGISEAQIDVAATRARARGETPPRSREVIEKVLAPLLYRILFTDQAPSLDDVRRWLDEVLSSSR